ncbi:MAG: glycine cleavage system aminomethyltransferase GcvT [Cyanobacteria bacterium J06648_16]
MLQTPLHSLHVRQGARMVPFSGWEMPVQFTGIRQEHQAVRTAAGMFDISHMGKFVLTGTGIVDALQQLVPTDLSCLAPGKAQYTVLLNADGGIIDDLIVYDQGQQNGAEQVSLIVNAATTDKDKTWLQSHLPASVTLQDVSRTQALIAVQGPQSVAKLQSLVAADLSQVPRYHHIQSTIQGKQALLARTGYTGEDGFEVMVEAETGPALWQALEAVEVIPCGLGARNTLRLEAAMALYGQDIDETTSPLEAGLGWLVHLDKPQDFMGRSVLVQQKSAGVKRKLVGLQLAGRNIARHDYPIVQDGQPVGIVTSGTLSPTLGYPIALAYVPVELAKVGQTVSVEIRQKFFPAAVVKRPFYKSMGSGITKKN